MMQIKNYVSPQQSTLEHFLIQDGRNFLIPQILKNSPNEREAEIC